MLKSQGPVKLTNESMSPSGMEPLPPSRKNETAWRKMTEETIKSNVGANGKIDVYGMNRCVRRVGSSLRNAFLNDIKEKMIKEKMDFGENFSGYFELTSQSTQIKLDKSACAADEVWMKTVEACVDKNGRYDEVQIDQPSSSKRFTPESECWKEVVKACIDKSCRIDNKKVGVYTKNLDKGEQELFLENVKKISQEMAEKKIRELNDHLSKVGQTPKEVKVITSVTTYEDAIRASKDGRGRSNKVALRKYKSDLSD